MKAWLETLQPVPESLYQLAARLTAAKTRKPQT
jgi:hypothetical protein